VSIQNSARFPEHFFSGHYDLPHVKSFFNRPE
jgi:hypothetical protein